MTNRINDEGPEDWEEAVARVQAFEHEHQWRHELQQALESEERFKQYAEEDRLIPEAVIQDMIFEDTLCKVIDSI